MSAAPPGPSPRSVDSIVHGRVVTLNRTRDVILDGAVAIAGGDIVAVGPREDVLRSNQARQMIGGRAPSSSPA
jgi:predicted amidohydrolase YtcJ